MTTHRFELTFQRTDCLGCGADRIVGVACPDCGAMPKPSEVDVRLQRRTKVVTELLAAMDAAGPVLPQHADLESGLHLPYSTIPAFDDFVEGLKQAAASEFRSTDDLAAAVEKFRSLRTATAAISPRRPFAKPVAIAVSMVADLEQLIVEYLGAYMARTPLEAQRHGEAGQRLLDSLADQRASLEEWLERRTAVSETESVAQSLGASVTDAMRISGVSTLVELAASRPTALTEVFGADPDLGSVIRYAWHQSVADLFLDAREYDRKLKVAASVFEAPDNAFEALVRDPVFQADLNRLELEILDEALRCQETIGSATNIRRAARAVVALNATLLEAAGATVAAPLLAARGTKTRPYAKLKDDNATDLIRSVGTTASLPDLVAGLDPHLRTAQSHAKVTYGEDFLTTDLGKGSRTYQYDDLVDSTFEALESMLPVLLCVHEAMARRGLVTDDASTLTSLGLSTQEVVDAFFHGFGATINSAVVNDGSLMLTADTNQPTGVTTALFGLLKSLGPCDIEKVVVAQSDGSTWTLAAEAIHGTTIDKTDDFASELSTIRLQRSWRDEAGHPRLSNAVVRKWVALKAVPALDLPTRELFVRLRDLRAIAIELGDPGCAEVVRSLTGWARLMQQGTQPTADEARVLDTIRDWLEDPAMPEAL